MSQASNSFIHLVAWKLTAFARFGSLRHLDLQLIRVHQVVCRDAKPCRGNLLDRAAPKVAVFIPRKTRFVLATFASVRLSSNPIHRNGQCLVRFLADGTERHSSCGESLHNILRRFHFFQRHRHCGFTNAHQTPQGA